jgi:hypothetical protein
MPGLLVPLSEASLQNAMPHLPFMDTITFSSCSSCLSGHGLVLLYLRRPLFFAPATDPDGGHPQD